MDIGKMIGDFAGQAGKALAGGGGLDLGKIAGDVGKAVGGAPKGGGGDPLGGIVKEGAKLLSGNQQGPGGDPLGSLVKQFTGGGDAKGGNDILGNLFKGSPLGDLAKGTDLKGIGKMLNPNLPDDQATGLDNASSAIKMIGGGGLGQMLQAGDASKAGQLPGTPDKALARKNADKAIAEIDWSKDTIGLWVPGTGGRGVDKKFADGMGPNASTVAVDYQADLNMPDGVATGMETTQIILDEAARRGKKVNLGGHSQGAWVAGEVMANPGMRDKVNKAVLYGHPTQGNAQYDHGKDPKVREINNHDDPYTQPTVDLTKIIPFLIGQGDPNIGKKHAYDFSSEGAWLRA